MSANRATLAGEPPAADAAGVVVARQPIFDSRCRLAAYELLYRGGSADRAQVTDGDRATASVATASFLDIGIERLVAAHPAFINVPRELVLSGAVRALPAPRVVIEILEDVVVDGALVDAVSQLVAAGYRIALDDFAFDPRWRPLLALAHIVKIDVLALGMERVREHVSLLAPYQVKLLAEKVETAQEHQTLQAMGFHYYQGYFFAKPVLVKGARLTGNRLALVKLLAVLQDPATGIDAVAALVAQDPSLSYRLIRFINSAFVALPARLTSIHRAVLYLGLDTVKRWVALMALASIEDKPSELVRTALVRAHMTERLCAATQCCDPATGFTVGLFSLLDAFMDQPMADLLAQLPLSHEVQTALLDGTGAAGRMLRCVQAYERADWETARHLAGDLPVAELADVYAEAIAWGDAAAAASRG